MLRSFGDAFRLSTSALMSTTFLMLSCSSSINAWISPITKPAQAWLMSRQSMSCFRAEPALNEAAGRRHEMVRRLGDEQQRVNLLAFQPAALKQVLQAEHRQVRHAYARLDHPALVEAHHFLELERTRLRKVEVLHVRDEGPFVGRHDDENARRCACDGK